MLGKCMLGKCMLGKCMLGKCMLADDQSYPAEMMTIRTYTL
jgi:hypothetical protein